MKPQLPQPASSLWDRATNELRQELQQARARIAELEAQLQDRPQPAQPQEEPQQRRRWWSRR